VLFIGPAGVAWKTEYYIRRAFTRAGHRVFWFNPMRLAGVAGGGVNGLCRGFSRIINPDFVLVTRGRMIRPQTLGAICRGRRSAMWYFDAPPAIPEAVAALARETGAFFITSRGLRDVFRRRGIRNPLFLPQACDAELHTRMPPDAGFPCGLSFVGSAGNSEYRRRMLAEIAQRTDLHIWGRNGPGEVSAATVHRGAFFNRKLAVIIGHSAAMLGLNSYEPMNAIDCCTSNRIWTTLGCGGLYLGHRTPGLNDLVAQGVYADYFSSVDEAAEKAAWYRSHPDLREGMCARGHAWAHARHTYDQRIKNLLEYREFSL